MKRFIGILMSCVLLATVLVGCNAKTTDTAKGDTSFEYIKEKGEIVVGLDDTFAPMGFRDESNNLVGFDIDLANEVGKELGVNVKFQPIVWDAKEMELNGKNIDLIWNGMSKTPEREASMNLSDPYLNNTLVIMTQKGSDIAKKSDLVGKKIGVQAGSSGLKVVQEDAIYDDIKDSLVDYENYDQALMDLEIGRVDAVIVDKVLGRYKASKKADAYDFAEEDFGEDLYVIGLRKGDDALTAELNKAIKNVVKSGKAAEISKKWFGEDVVIK